MKVKRTILLFCYLAILLILIVAGCAVPTPTISPLPFPSRIPPTATPSPTGAAVYYEAGLACRARGDMEGALSFFAQALDADPSFAPAYVQRSTIYLAQGDAEAALTEAQMATTFAPDDGAAYALLGEVLRAGFGDLGHALTAYERAVQLDPALADVTFLPRWQAALATGQNGRLVALGNEYMHAHPDDPLAAYYKGLALVAVGNHNGAIFLLSEAVQEHGDVAALWFALGEAYAADGAWQQAKVCYEQARTLAEAGEQSLNIVSAAPVADLFAGLGRAYVNAGECASGIVMLEHALAVGPERDELHTLVGQAMICLTPTPTPLPYPWWTP